MTKRKLPQEGGNTWFMGSLVVEYWIDDETGGSEVLLSNGKRFEKKTNDPFEKYTEITSAQTRASDTPR